MKIKEEGSKEDRQGADVKKEKRKKEKNHINSALGKFFYPTFFCPKFSYAKFFFYPNRTDIGKCTRLYDETQGTIKKLFLHQLSLSSLLLSSFVIICLSSYT